MAFYSGINGYFKKATAALKMSEWTLEISVEPPDTTNFVNGGYQSNLDGVKKAKITGKGPYDSGSMPFTAGEEATLVVGIYTATEFSVPCRITSIRIDNSVKDKPMLVVEAISNGSFTAAVT
jgi:hypothetical protein